MESSATTAPHKIGVFKLVMIASAFIVSVRNLSTCFIHPLRWLVL